MLEVVIRRACEWFSGCEVVRMEHGGLARREANLEGDLVKGVVCDVVGAPALVRDVVEPDCPDDGTVINGSGHRPLSVGLARLALA